MVDYYEYFFRKRECVDLRLTKEGEAGCPAGSICNPELNAEMKFC